MRPRLPISLLVLVGSLAIGACSKGLIEPDRTQATVTDVSVTPSRDTIVVGATVQLSAHASTSDNSPAPAVVWRSTAPDIAVVTDGLVRGVAPGRTQIVAQVGASADTADVWVIASSDPVLPPPPPPPAGSLAGMWLSADESRALPASGAAWDNVKRAADSDLSGGVLSTRDDHNVRTMAAGLVATRLNSDVYRAKVRESLRGVMAAPIDGSDPLAIVRRLGTYAIAADLIDLKTFDPAFDGQFRTWLDRTRKTQYGGETVAAIHERRPNNWGTHAGVSRIAAAIYLGDRAELERAAQVFKGWLGDRTAYAGFSYNDVDWWQADPSKPVGINPKGATRDGHSIDGVLPDDERRAGAFTWPPPKENYVYTALEGALGEAVLLSRQGYDVWNWSDRALLRSFVWLHEQANFPAEGNDAFQPYIVNRAYGTNFPAPLTSSPGRNIGWADWTHQK